MSAIDREKFEEGEDSEWNEAVIRTYEKIRDEIQSGAFDVRETEEDNCAK